MYLSRHLGYATTLITKESALFSGGGGYFLSSTGSQPSVGSKPPPVMMVPGSLGLRLFINLKVPIRMMPGAVPPFPVICSSVDA